MMMPRRHVFLTVTALFGDGRFIHMPNPLPGSEDFSFVLDQVPGAFIMMGACPAGTDPAGRGVGHDDGGRGGLNGDERTDWRAHPAGTS